jgi:hypothetical protein
MYKDVCDEIWGLHGCEISFVSYVSWHRIVWDIGSNVSEETSAVNLNPDHAASCSTRTIKQAGSFETSVSVCKIHDTSV